MRRFKNQKKKLSMTIALVLIVFIGLAYAFLNEKLIINNILSYNSMNFEVGFIDVTDGGGTIKPTSTVSNDGKTINISCNIGNSIDQESCITKATIINNSSFNIGLSTEPKIIYDDTYIHTLTVKWSNHPTFLNTTVHQNGFIKQGESEEIIITVKTKFLDKNNLPASGTQIPITIEFDFVEYPEATLPKTTDLAILPSFGCGYDGDLIQDGVENLECSNKNLEDFDVNAIVKTLTFQRGTEIPQEAIENDAVGYLTDDIVVYGLINEKYSNEDVTFLDVYVQSDKQIYANEDMAYYFMGMANLEEINGLELLDTSMTTNMEGMFAYLGREVENVSYDLSTLDTSNVENMRYMFLGAGAYSKNVNINVSSLDTSKVKDMSYMFAECGASLNSNNNVSTEINNVTELNNLMGINNLTSPMYLDRLTNITEVEEGTETIELILDVSNFDTSKVTNMRGMFAMTGCGKSKFELNVSNFDTSNVTDMATMFEFAGINSPNFTLDVSNFDTKKVNDMSFMFAFAAIGNTIFTIDVSDFDTSNVTDMEGMFLSAGWDSSVFELNVSRFDTSKVTNMSSMFYGSGYSNPTFKLDVSRFDTSKVTNMSSMFYRTGYSNPTFTLDVSNFNTSKVTNMTTMFYETGYNSTMLNTSITIRNPNVSYSSMLYGVATQTGTSFVVNYTSDTAGIIESIVNTSSSKNVVKGVQVE